jgi:nucleotide sugar dehydrogenase
VIETLAKTIYVKGMWHQGLVAAAVWASDGFQVVGLCDSIQEVESLNAGHVPVLEPGLQELLIESLNSGTLSFQIISDTLPAPDYLCFMHDTEVDDDDRVSTEKFFHDIEALKSFIETDVQVLITSQLPPSTCDIVLENLYRSLNFYPNLAYMPENLRLGKAIERFRNPPLPVFGLNKPETLGKLATLFPNTPKFETCSLVEAELLKSSLNVFLAISVTFGNEISEICDSFGADGSKVMRLLRLESRIGNQLPFLPGMPFSGGTLGRDVRNLEQAPTSNPNGLIKSIWKSNHHRGNYLIEVIRETGRKNSLKKIGLLGLTYKTDTSTLRRSYPLEVFSGVHSDFDFIGGFDPMSSVFKEDLPKALALFESIDDLFNEVELLVITTPWTEIIDFLNHSGLGSKHLIDPFGVLALSFQNEPNYYHFGGQRSLK